MTVKVHSGLCMKYSRWDICPIKVRAHMCLGVCWGGCVFSRVVIFLSKICLMQLVWP